MHSTSNTSENIKPKISVQETSRKYQLPQMPQKWFISPLDGKAVNVDPQAKDGANDEQWIAFLAQFINLNASQRHSHWGLMRRCDVLNWLDAAEIQPKFFDSKEDAENFG